MHIERLELIGFRRFHHLTIDLPTPAKLVVLSGPNGSGKSCIFDALRVWHTRRIATVMGGDKDFYFNREGSAPLGMRDRVKLTFHETLSGDVKHAIYVRTAYRNESDLKIDSLTRSAPDSGDLNAKLITPDFNLQRNYTSLVSSAIAAVFNGNDAKTPNQIKEEVIGPLRDALQRVFPELHLKDLGDPLSDAGFYFNKGTQSRFHFRNLSSAEKSVLNLLLDLIIKRTTFSNSIVCIDEPETHLNSRVQGALLTEIVNLLSNDCQLWIATHSIGMMRRAKEIWESCPENVAFINLADQDFDGVVNIQPSPVNRRFWTSTLRIALDDLAFLVAPKHIVLCEGRPQRKSNDPQAEFDARCFRTIFGEQMPDVEFVSVGSSLDVADDSKGLLASVGQIVAGAKVSRIIDRDDMNAIEIRDLRTKGVCVLKRRHIEAYLLDGEIIQVFCNSLGKADLSSEVLAAKTQAIKSSTAPPRSNPDDDVKSAAGEIYNHMKRILRLSGKGSDVHSFMRDHLAPLITPETKVFAELRAEIFADSGEESSG